MHEHTIRIGAVTIVGHTLWCLVLASGLHLSGQDCMDAMSHDIFDMW